MGKQSNIDKAVQNLMKWMEQPGWLKEQTARFDVHLAPVCDHLNISQEELIQELEEAGFGGMLFGMVFEDFVCRRLPPNDKNIIDDYLKRRGWRESVPGRRYLQELRDSVLSLYEVTKVSPGRHCDLRDLVRGGETIRVHEHKGTRNMVKWDRIAARLLHVNGNYVFSGGMLPFPQEVAQDLLRVLAESRKEFKREHSWATGMEARTENLEENLDELFLQEAAPAFTSIWLMDILERLHGPMPEMVNRDEETLVFTETRFPFVAEQLDEIMRRLDAASEWERDNPDGTAWVWLPEPDASGKKSIRGLSIETYQGGQRLISGTLALAPGALTLTTNSVERTNRAKEVLAALLDGLVGPALIKLQTPEQLMTENQIHRNSDNDGEPADSIDPELAAEVIHNMLDQHYRQCLDEPIPMLGDKSPRQRVKSRKGKEQVIEWLKSLENNELRRAATQGHKPYDSRWMWDELKLDAHRVD